MKLIRVLFLLGSLLMMGGTMVACGPPPPPDPPTNIATSSDKNIDGKIVWTFEIDEKNKSRVASVKILRDSSSEGDFSNEVGSFTLDQGELDKEKRVYKFTFTDTNVLPGDKYGIAFYYKFVSVAPDGQKGSSNALDAKSTNAEAPVEVDSQAIQSSNLSGGAEIVVSWNANKEHDIKGYYVFRSESDEPIPVTQIDDAVSPLIKHDANKSTFSWIDKNITEGKPYWYVVIAVDKGDEIGRRKPATRFRGMVLSKAKLTAPGDGTDVASPTFKWEKVDSASGYVVVILDDAVGGEVVWRSDYVTDSEVTYKSEKSLTTGKKYYWYVYTFLEKPKSNDEKGNSRSELWSFKAQ